MTIGAVDKIKPLGQFKVVDASDIEETNDKQFCTSGERTGLAALRGAIDPASVADRVGEYTVDNGGTKGHSTAIDGALEASAARFERATARRLFTRTMSFIDSLGRNAGSSGAGSAFGKLFSLFDTGNSLALHVREDSGIEASFLKTERLRTRDLRTTTFGFLDRLGKAAGALGITGVHRSPYVVSDSAATIGLLIGDDGTAQASFLKADKVRATDLQVMAFRIVDRLGRAVGTFGRSNGPGVSQIADTAGVLGLEVRADGSADLPLPQASRWAGGRLSVSAGYLVEARYRPSGRREVWLSDLATGAFRKLSKDASSDYLDPHVLPVSPSVPVAMCACIKRRGSSEQRIALPLDGSGTEYPLRPSPSILFHGDSFLNNNMGPTIMAGLAVGRPSRVVNSGGSYLTAAVARLAGGTVPIAEAGSNAAAGGGFLSNADGTPNGGGGYYTYPGLPQHWSWTYVHVEGGYEDLANSTDPASAVAPVITRFQQLKATLTPAVKRCLFAQSGITRDSTPAQVTFKLACDALIAAALPAEWVPTYDYMRANGTGSLVGPNGGAVWPADTYGDSLHPNAVLAGTAIKTGVQLFAAPIAAVINARGW